MTNALVGLLMYRARRYDDALDVLRRATELDPDHPTPYLPRGLALSMLERHAEAIAALERGAEASGRGSEMVAQRAGAYGRAGDSRRARELLGELQDRARTRHVSPVAFALAYAGLGHQDEAIRALEEAYRSREWALCVLETEPIFDPLRSDPRFQDLIRPRNLPRTNP